jgi:hypothetical protein
VVTISTMPILSMDQVSQLRSIQGKYPAFGAIDAFGTAEVVSGLGRKSLLPLGRALSLRVSSWGGLVLTLGFSGGRDFLGRGGFG